MASGHTRTRAQWPPRRPLAHSTGLPRENNKKTQPRHRAHPTGSLPGRLQRGERQGKRLPQPPTQLRATAPVAEPARLTHCTSHLQGAHRSAPQDAEKTDARHTAHRAHHTGRRHAPHTSLKPLVAHVHHCALASIQALRQARVCHMHTQWKGYNKVQPKPPRVHGLAGSPLTHQAAWQTGVVYEKEGGSQCR